ncbi:MULTISPECIES: superoxide dismutase family protein [unclassified Rhizobium]|uniref:superoxide dismutase family protein n=1 Tax=unclassified Rhizobium TaxID=2613769 RepID=UPI00047664E2|nr:MULTISPECIES: superoxide dismutase family protein [unclassified Rhizobium]MBO9123315.1 superoxide dismutase family protein [Rhizobium sp. 16-488-2b]MBO9173847.1 superoxide dismutase family protein [Rhizobium sp. 16-488-2a]
MKRLLSLAFATVAALATVAVAQDKQTAQANFVGADGKDDGRATLTAAAAGGVLIELEVSGLPANKWVAFHVHETGKCDAASHHESAGKHFNPTKAEHGLLAAKGPHAGDMPNQYVGQDGVLRAQVFDGMVTLDGKENGIRGRALMIHENSDDYRSQPAGDAGARLACAVIK